MEAKHYGLFDRMMPGYEYADDTDKANKPRVSLTAEAYTGPLFSST